MKLKPAIALGTAVLLAVSFGALAEPAEDTAPYGKHLTSIEAVAKSRPGSFDVYIDAPTGFAFVNTPAGWKFTRKVQDDSPVLAELRLRQSGELLTSAAQSQQ
ncbi:hypothetical protein [Azoarcus sp. KH32C]|uniref:hypothetical protein n=1 Tax=Azoarcus sp. KH32C TaxID=748247 RepID=UPI0002385DD0|nr:hypothetical protein [Azoarcus sp. KH32C]BAL27134.1 hypothetical protein AZKH_p0251 [Azoarcus sp. KH32C]